MSCSLGGSQLDALVTDPNSFGHVLASEAYEAVQKMELLNDHSSKDHIMALPDDCNLKVELWHDKNDHSKGTFTRRVRLLRFSYDEDGDPQIEPVDMSYQRGTGTIEFKNVTDWGNFKQMNA